MQTIFSNVKIIVAQAFFFFTTILRIFLTKLLCHSYSTEFQHHTLNENSSECFNETRIFPSQLHFVCFNSTIYTQSGIWTTLQKCTNHTFSLIYITIKILCLLDWYMYEYDSLLHCMSYIVWITSEPAAPIYWRTVYRFLIRSMLLSPYKFYFM